jgi:Leucine-rich repeat (LRR) protein
LIYFKNLTSLDLSDNAVNMGALKNLSQIEYLDLQYNKLDFL